MARSVSLSSSPRLTAVSPRAATEAMVVLHNSGHLVDQPTVIVEGVERGWFSLPGSGTALVPNHRGTLKGVFCLPAEATKGDPFLVRARMISQQATGAVAIAADLSSHRSATRGAGLAITSAVVAGLKRRPHVAVATPVTTELTRDAKVL